MQFQIGHRRIVSFWFMSLQLFCSLSWYKFCIFQSCSSPSLPEPIVAGDQILPAAAAASPSTPTKEMCEREERISTLEALFNTMKEDVVFSHQAFNTLSQVRPVLIIFNIWAREIRFFDTNHRQNFCKFRWEGYYEFENFPYFLSEFKKFLIFHTFKS